MECQDQTHALGSSPGCNMGDRFWKVKRYEGGRCGDCCSWPQVTAIEMEKCQQMGKFKLKSSGMNNIEFSCSKET